MPWDQTQELIRSGHRNPEDYDPESLKTITLSEEEGIQAIIGKKPDKEETEAISYLFNKQKGWTLEKAKTWLKEHEKKEAFSWAGTIKNVPETRNLIRGKALHPIRTVHPNEWPQIRTYLEEELQKSAHTLEGTPLILDHTAPINGKVLGAEYRDGAIEYVAQLSDQQILNQISEGTIKHCSVELEWKTLEKLNGVALSTVETGEYCSVCTRGVVKVTAGAAITRGTAVQTNADANITALEDGSGTYDPTELPDRISRTVGIALQTFADGDTGLIHVDKA